MSAALDSLLAQADRPSLPEPLPSPVVDDHVHLEMAAPQRRGATGEVDREDVPVGDLLAAAATVGVSRAVQIGCDVAGAHATVELLERFPQLLGGVALHPNEAPRLAALSRTELVAGFAEIERIVTHPRVRVVGETGLDYFRTGPEGIAVQQESFRWHIDLAKRSGLALQIHDREAHEDVLRILDEEGAPERTVFHCFSGNAAMAHRCVDAGYVLSFSGTVTFANAQSLRDALTVVPLDQLQVETDAPFLTPVPHRGRSNASYLVPLTVRAMAEVLGVGVPQLCDALAVNSERIYGPWV
ncbi:MAG: TatD family hydrolase [Actinomycetota bacterium]